MNILTNTVKLAHHLILPYVNDRTVAVDCTLGNGFDTIALMEMGINKIYAFDIQNRAISEAKKNISKAKNQNKRFLDTSITTINDSHENMDKYVQSCDVAIFNLGYLPNGDKSITTSTASTIAALEKCLSLLNRNGICIIVVYDGHDLGHLEKQAVLNFASTLDTRQFHSSYVSMINQPKNPPEIIAITKK